MFWAVKKKKRFKRSHSWKITFFQWWLCSRTVLYCLLLARNMYACQLSASLRLYIYVFIVFNYRWCTGFDQSVLRLWALLVASGPWNTHLVQWEYQHCVFWLWVQIGFVSCLLLKRLRCFADAVYLDAVFKVDSLSRWMTAAVSGIRPSEGKEGGIYTTHAVSRQKKLHIVPSTRHNKVCPRFQTVTT